ncbi:SDR family NAD(P)-dependent oxidoreductase [Streptomyces griseus]|uniref:SDR family NAD(P)-dependent oxidoreductase n=1 Tax=Streptomyces griseus TaxID=1911 RepID=UPI0036F82E82
MQGDCMLLNMYRFQDRVAVVTGGGSGIGRATAQRLAAEGARVWILDRDEDRAEPVAAELRAAGHAAHARAIDVSDAVSVTDVVTGILDQESRLDVMVNNAGITLAGTVWETDPADWARVVAVNLGGVFNGIRAVFPAMMKTGGAIVNTASDAGLVGWPGQAAYGASKSGVVGLTRSAAMDGAPFGIRVNAVCPGFTETPLVDAWLAAEDDPLAARRAAAAEQPLGRMAEPGEIAAAIAYLGSDEAAFVTGVALPVDGGVTAR